MAMYLNLSAQNDNLLDQQQDNNSAPHTPLDQSDSQQSLPSITGKRKCMDKESNSNTGKGMRTIDPFSLMGEDSGSGKFFKRQRLDSVNSTDFSIPLTTNDETFTSSYVFLHSTVSRPASSNNNNQSQPSSQTSYQSGYQSNGPEEERILREEFFSQQQLPQGFLSSGGASGSFGNLAGYSLPHYPVAPPQAASPYMLPSFGPPLMQAPPVPHYNNGYFPSMQAPPPDLYYPRAEQLYNRPSYPPTAMMSGGGGGQSGSLPEEFIAETKLSKNIKKMTTVLGQIPGLEKIRWQSILQGTRSPDVGERETQRRVKEAETIGARLFGGDIDKLLGSILNQHLDFLVTYVANLKNGKKKHNKIRMQLSKVLADAAAANNNNNSNNNSPQSD